MMAPAQETSVGNLGFAAVTPMDEVMAITPRGWAVAAWKTAVLVASGERAARLLGQRFDRSRHGQMRLLASDLRKCTRVQALAADLDQSIRPALAARRLIVGLKRVLASPDCRAQWR